MYNQMSEERKEAYTATSLLSGCVVSLVGAAPGWFQGNYPAMLAGLFIGFAIPQVPVCACYWKERYRTDTYGIESQAASGRSLYGAFSSDKANEKKLLFDTPAAGKDPTTADTLEVVVDGPTI